MKYKLIAVMFVVVCFSSCRRNSYLCECFDTSNPARPKTQHYDMGRRSSHRAEKICNMNIKASDSCSVIDLH